MHYMLGSSGGLRESLHVVVSTAPPRWSMRSLAPTKAALVRGVGPMDWSSAGPLWQRQSAGESRWARTEAVGEGRATSPTSLQPRVPQMYQLLVQLAHSGVTHSAHICCTRTSVSLSETDTELLFHLLKQECESKIQEPSRGVGIQDCFGWCHTCD